MDYALRRSNSLPFDRYYCSKAAMQKERRELLHSKEYMTCTVTDTLSFTSPMTAAS